ncbi:MAG TPA: hypothetical protein VL281_08265 [Mycobacteriales bacterium]|nr:hypothetical protein [Mycobacteriales bacterium]
MSTYCAPCLADLALVREAVTSVSGTAACVAHAVLLTHPHDNPQRRLTRLSDLRAMAEGKLATASAEDVPAIELLVQEYALAGAMDMTVPLKELAGDRTPRPPKTRNRGRGRDRDGRPEGRPGGDRPGGERGPRPEAPAGERAPETLVTGAASVSEPTSPTPEVSAAESAPAPSQPDSPAADSAPAPAAPAPEAAAAAPEAPAAPAPEAPAAPAPEAPVAE